MVSQAKAQECSNQYILASMFNPLSAFLPVLFMQLLVDKLTSWEYVEN